MKQFLQSFALSMSVAIAVGGSGLAMTESARANSLDNEMGNMFEGVMTNTTRPGTIESARRGGWSGGAFTSRSKIMSVRPISMVSPSFSAGCGGIDLTGGSFSFINADQFVEFAKTVAQNAVGYAFYLATESFMPSVRTIMNDIQKQVTRFNRMFSNSCKLAQDGVNALVGAENNEAALDTVNDGISDVFSSFSSQDGRSPTEEQSDNRDLYQNIMMTELRGQNVQNWFDYGDDEFLEILMNITGTIVIGGTREDDAEGSSPVREVLAGNQITLEDLVSPRTSASGGSNEVTYRPCAAVPGAAPDACLDFGEPESIQIEGFSQRAGVMLEGILDRIYVGESLSENQQRFLSALPAPAPSMLFRLSRISPEIARNWASDYAKPIGLAMAYNLLSELHRAGYIAASMSNNVWANELREILTTSRQQIQNDYEALRDQYGTIRDAMDEYAMMIEAMPKSGIMSPNTFATDAQ